MRMQVRRAAKQSFPSVRRAFERVGVHVQPVHYYSDVPDRRWLDAHREHWAQPVIPHGLEWDLDRQLAWLEERCGPYIEETTGASLDEAAGVADFGPGFGPVEAQVLHCLIRSEPPRRVVEVGSGFTTWIMSEASKANSREGHGSTTFTCVEPFPYPALHALDVEILEAPAQAVPLSLYDELEADDLLFIDSTHTVRTGSEVIPLYLSVIPRLAAGVRIHIHDIFLPYLFHPNVLNETYDWQETALLAALLTDNPSLEVDTCLSALTVDRPGDLARIIPDYVHRPLSSGLQQTSDGHYPASIWLRKT